MVKPVIKIVIVGDSAVGKTSLLKNFLQGKATETKSTIGVDLYTIEKDGVSLVFWDFAGQIWLREVIIELLQGALIVLIIFDLSRVNTLTSVLEFWVPKIKEYCNPNALVFLVGNKLDIKNINDDIIQNVINALKKEINLLEYMETTIMNKNTVDQLYEKVIKNALKIARG